ncbi:MAG: Ig-like domain-containing protein [Bacteroidales bacterium]|nr:Ig-like domain-containing protein [Bacteroidales bacterium]
MSFFNNTLVLSLFAALLMACNEKPVEDETIHVRSVSVNPTELSLKVGETGTVSATLVPENATDKAISWSSSNPAVATVADGVVTAVAPGSTNILATSHDSMHSAGCAVNVSEDKKFSFRLMTFNILQGGKSDGTTDKEGHEWNTVRKTPCLNMFKDTDPDIIMLQECRREQLKNLKSSMTGYTFYSYAKDGVLASGYTAGDATNDSSFKNGGQRNVILLRTSLFETLEWGRFWLSDTPDTPSNGFGTTGQKITLWLKVRHKGSGAAFYLFNTHFIPQSYGNAVNPVVDVIPPCASVNVAQMKKILGNTNAPVFFAGDLNCSNSSDKMAAVNSYLRHAGMDAPDTDKSMTFNGFRDDATSWTLMDHIYYDNASPKVYKVVNSDGYGTKFISDHFPVYCDFEIQP